MFLLTRSSFSQKAMFAAPGRSGPRSSPVSLLLFISAVYFCGIAFATSSHQNIGRQDRIPSLTPCVEVCRPGPEGLATFCDLPISQRLEQLTKCAKSSCNGKDPEASELQVLLVSLCGIAAPPTSVVDIGTALVTDTGVTSIIPSTTARKTSSRTTESQTITPTTDSSGSKDDSDSSSTGGNKEKKNGSELSIPVIVAIAVGGTALLAICAGLWFLIACIRKRKRREREQKKMGDKGFDNSSMSDSGDRGIPLGSGFRKEIGNTYPWVDEESNNGSTAQLYSKPAADKPRLPPITTKALPPQPRGGAGDASSGDVSPVSPVSPLSEYATFDERRSKAISTVSSVKAEGRTHRDFYNVTSPPLPTPGTGKNSRFPSTRLPTSNKLGNIVTRTATNRSGSGYPPEPVSPLSRNPSGKSIATTTRSEVSAIGEDQFGWEGYRDMIRKYEEHQAQGKPIPPDVIQRLSGLSQFNFGFGAEQQQKREDTMYGGYPANSNPGGYLDVPAGKNREKHLSGSSSVYSSQPMTPPPPIDGHGPGPSTPDMFFGRSGPAYPPPSPPLGGRSEGRIYTAVSDPSSSSEPPTGGLARANSLRWRREVEAATDQALSRISPNPAKELKGPQKSSGFWSLLTPKLGGASPKIGTVNSGTGSVMTIEGPGGDWPEVVPARAASEVSLVSEDGRVGL